MNLKLWDNRKVQVRECRAGAAKPLTLKFNQKNTNMKKAVLIKYENYYSTDVLALVEGTKDVNRAVKAIKSYEDPFQALIKRTWVYTTQIYHAAKFDVYHHIKELE